MLVTPKPKPNPNPYLSPVKQTEHSTAGAASFAYIEYIQNSSMATRATVVLL